MLAGTAAYMVRVDEFSVETLKGRRLDVWNMSFCTAMLKPWLGWGFNQYKFVVPILTSRKYMRKDAVALLYVQIDDHKTLMRAVEMFKGMDGSFFSSVRQKKRLWKQAHNEYLEFLFVGGIVGVLFGLWCLARHLVAGWKRPDVVPFLGLLASAVTATVFFSWHIMPIAVVTVVYMGLCTGEEEFKPPS